MFQTCRYLNFLILAVKWAETSSDVYYLAFPKDKKLFKFLAYGILTLETTQAIFLTRDMLRALLYEVHLCGGHSVKFWFVAPLIAGIGQYVILSYF
ncbi:hypothetical protein AMATHDRAFT_69576 [Amanita thiersii Skay4041]|uniref:Uncharacterized protein n=1 Tax=Amanita thiersii Skay4041 TaxID=703135 RepID=A0A2A9N7Q5_9AGAR|nr:hypothetical protein AMATHDRAFT_69576 [Amanita thiersii Skay4041]